MSASWLITSYFQPQRAGSIAMPWMCQRQNQSLFHTQIWAPRPPAFFFFFFIVVVVVCFSRLANMTQFMTWMRYRGISYCSGLLLPGLVRSFPCVHVPSGLEAKLLQQGLGQRSAASGRGLSQTAEWYSCVSWLTMLEFAMDTAKCFSSPIIKTTNS